MQLLNNAGLTSALPAQERDRSLCRFCEQDPTASISFLQDRLHAKAEEIAALKAEVRRLQRSRMLSVEGLPTSGDTVTIPAAELSAMKKDLEVLLPFPQFDVACREPGPSN